MVFEDVQSADVRLVARVRGEGRPVLLFHGFPDTFETWTAAAMGADESALEDRLIAAGFRTIALAMRGYPPSSVPRSGDYSLRALAGDIVAVLDHFGIQRGLIVGHDWGASAAYAAAALHPDRIERMAVFAIPPFPVLPSGLRERLVRPHNIYLTWGTSSAWLLRRNRAALVERLYRTWSPNWKAPPDHVASVRTALSDPDRAAAAVGYYSAPLSEEDRCAIVRPIIAPTVAIYGADEPITRRQAFSRALPHLGPGSHVVPLEGVGHWPHLEAAERAGNLVTESMVL